MRSAKTRAQCSYTLKTAKRELATPKGHSSQPPSGSRHRWPPLQPPSPSSPPPSWLWQCCHLPLTMLCCLSASKSGVLYSHQLLCKPRPVLYTLSSVKWEGSLRQTQLSSKSPSLEFMWTSSSELEGTSPPGHLTHFSPLPSLYRQETDTQSLKQLTQDVTSDSVG